jgi:hypothetical protein
MRLCSTSTEADATGSGLHIDDHDFGQAGQVVLTKFSRMWSILTTHFSNDRVSASAARPSALWQSRTLSIRHHPAPFVSIPLRAKPGKIRASGRAEARTTRFGIATSEVEMSPRPLPSIFSPGISTFSNCSSIAITNAPRSVHSRRRLCRGRSKTRRIPLHVKRRFVSQVGIGPSVA